MNNKRLRDRIITTIFRKACGKKKKRISREGLGERDEDN